jgi:hypothetical protein
MQPGTRLPCAVCPPLPRQSGCRHPATWHRTPRHPPSLPQHPSCTNPPSIPDFRLQIQDVGISALGKLSDGVAIANYQLYRARKADIKGVEAVGSKSMGTKRAAPDDQVRSSRKKQKTQPTQDGEVRSKSKEDQTKDSSTQDGVFRFMDLPGGMYI